jgi:hypothetical protein
MSHASSRRPGIADRHREPFRDALDRGGQPRLASGTAPEPPSFGTRTPDRLSRPSAQRGRSAEQRHRATRPGTRSRQPPTAVNSVETPSWYMFSLAESRVPAQTIQEYGSTGEPSSE